MSLFVVRAAGLSLVLISTNLEEEEKGDRL